MFSYWAKPHDTHALAQLLNDHIAAVVRAAPPSPLGRGGEALRAGEGSLFTPPTAPTSHTSAQSPVTSAFSRFLALGTVPLQDPTLAIRELERCITQLKFPGIQIGTNINGKNLSDPSLNEFYAAAQSLNAAIFVHPWDMVQYDKHGTDRMPDYWLPWLVGMPTETCLAICSVIFGGVLERFPKLKLAFAHGGGSFCGTLGRIQHGCEARPDLCSTHNHIPPKAYIANPSTNRPARFYVDSLVHDPRALALLIDTMGADRIMLGSDYPFPLGEDRPGSLIRNHPSLSDSVRTQMLGSNALHFLFGG
ncbi:MAG: amidohydrolase [Phycisphaerales bacterium]|nr:amidohydrolase [Phycisphaerales bacterium]